MAYGNRRAAGNGSQGKATYMPVTGFFLSKNGTSSTVKVNADVVKALGDIAEGDTLILFTEDQKNAKGDFVKTHSLKRIPNA